jgi:hypothetical protein
MTEVIKLSSDGPLLMIQGEHRQEDRTETVIHGELTAIDRAGRLFMTEITIENVNEMGCRFECGIPLQTGDIVAICTADPGPKSLSERRPHLFEVAWTNRRVAFWVIGATKLHDQTLLMIHFPALKFSPPDSPK